jgi:hypothetical protein
LNAIIAGMGDVPILAIFVAVAGPLGITLGWWLARRSERERASREERRNAYSEFLRTILAFRSANPDRRREIRGDRWAALAVLMLVAPPPVVQSGWALISVQEHLLDETDQAVTKSIQDGVWKWASRYVHMARADLGVRGEAFGQLHPTTTRPGPPVLSDDLLDMLDHDLAIWRKERQSPS